MSSNSRIEWTDATWNPVTGCTRVSPGCDRCYAVRMTRRCAAIGSPRYQGLIEAGKKHFNGVVKLHEDRLLEPLSWQKPKMVFVCSMSDLFHQSVPDAFITRCFFTMMRCRQHQFQVLTKRSERLLKFCAKHWEIVPLNAWLGVTVESQEQVERIRHLSRLNETHPNVRFVSFEPLLGPISLPEGSLIDWAIVGGETGSGARPMKEEWVTDLKRQCELLEIPFFFKQWGGRSPKTWGNRLLGGNTFDEMPRVPMAHRISELVTPARPLT